MLNKNSPGLLKKCAAKQGRIKSIAWHLRWLVRTRADIGLRQSELVRLRTDIKLQPSELVRLRADIKLRPSAFVRTRTDFKLQTVRLVSGKIIGLIQEQVYTQIFLNCHLAAF